MIDLIDGIKETLKENIDDKTRENAQRKSLNYAKCF